ncbi:MAG: DUF1836 domain-containing protein [Erysipelotrichaceae bacterium]|nr:DUF1836 domain-containing protein [Erysipelotrichaceae bacterium]
MRNFYLPHYEELPDFPLFAEQVINYIETNLKDYFFNDEKIITKSMINNYVKNGFIEAPVKKKYNKDQLVVLIIISILKKTFTLDEIVLIVNQVLNITDITVSYNYYCDDLQNCLTSIFNKEEIVHTPYHHVSDTFVYACQNVMLAVAHKIYLESLIKDRKEFNIE